MNVQAHLFFVSNTPCGNGNGNTVVEYYFDSTQGWIPGQLQSDAIVCSETNSNLLYALGPIGITGGQDSNTYRVGFVRAFDGTLGEAYYQGGKWTGVQY